jgi:DNA uptake protein ComE-like DNA-binding protein
MAHSRLQSESPHLGWTRSQRRGLQVLLLVLVVFLTFQVIRNRSYVPDPQLPQGARAPELQSRLDPNSADWHALAAIPTLGEKRAKAIVAYRESVLASNAHRTAYQSPGDLLHVRGIGAATLENLRPYLSFPSDRPDAQN